MNNSWSLMSWILITYVRLTQCTSGVLYDELPGGNSSGGRPPGNWSLLFSKGSRIIINNDERRVVACVRNLTLKLQNGLNSNSGVGGCYADPPVMSPCYVASSHNRWSWHKIVDLWLMKVVQSFLSRIPVLAAFNVSMVFYHRFLVWFLFPWLSFDLES